jgi:hypothetical protein
VYLDAILMKRTQPGKQRARQNTNSITGHSSPP